MWPTGQPFLCEGSPSLGPATKYNQNTRTYQNEIEKEVFENMFFSLFCLKTCKLHIAYNISFSKKNYKIIMRNIYIYIWIICQPPLFILKNETS